MVFTSQRCSPFNKVITNQLRELGILLDGTEGIVPIRNPDCHSTAALLNAFSCELQSRADESCWHRRVKGDWHEVVARAVQAARAMQGKPSVEKGRAISRSVFEGHSLDLNVTEKNSFCTSKRQLRK